MPAYLTVARTRWHQGVLLAGFEEAADRTAAEGLRIPGVPGVNTLVTVMVPVPSTGDAAPAPTP